MANGNSFSPLSALAAQVAQFAQEQTSPQTALARQNLAERQNELVRQNMASQFLSTADFSRDPAGALQTLAAITGNPGLVEASLNVRLKDKAFADQQRRLGTLAGEIEGVSEGGIDRPEAAQLLGSFTRAGQSAPAGIAGAAIAPSPEEQRAQRQNLELQETRLDLAKQRADQGGKPLTPSQRLSNIRGLRKDVQKSKPVQQFKEIRRQFSNMEKTVDEIKSGLAAGIGQQAILVIFQKMLDPISVVRESEFARTAATGQSLSQRLEAKARSILESRIVTDEAVDDIVRLSKELAKGAQEFANEEIQAGRDIAADFGLNPDRVGELFSDFGAPAPSTTGQAGAPQAGGQAAPGPGAATSAPPSQTGAPAAPAQAGAGPAQPGAGQPVNVDDHLKALGF